MPSQPIARPAALLLLGVLACRAPGREVPTVVPPNPAPSLEGARSEPRSPDPAPEDGATPGAADEAFTTSELGWVAGSPITAEDLILEWQQFDGRQLWLSVEKLVTTRLAFAEAQRLGLRLPPEAVEARYESDRRQIETDLRTAAGDEPLEEFLLRELGQRYETYFERLREGTIRQMLAERVVRAWTLASENLSLRLIVLTTDPEVEEVLALLSQGGDFEELARERSVDDSASEGGLVPFLVRQEHSPLARLAFASAVGEIAGPLVAAEHRILIRVEEVRAPQVGDWGVLAGQVEASLERHPVRDSEFLHWKVAMERRYPIDLAPLMKLCGAG